METGITRILAIIERRKRLAHKGNGLMQYSEYDEIESLALSIVALLAR